MYSRPRHTIRPMCIVGPHVLGAHKYSRPTSIVGPHVLWSICIEGTHVLWAHIYSKPTCTVHPYVLWDHMYIKPKGFVGSHV